MKRKNFKHFFGIQWHITDMCDQKCTHCYIFNSSDISISKGISLSDFELSLQKIIDFCSDIECNPSITITGGDPLLRKDLWNILSILKVYNIEFSILGNPFHLNNNTIKKLKSYGCSKYQLSIDGLEFKHDNIRKTGSFISTMNAIEVLKKSAIRVHVMYTLSKYNANDLLDVIDLLVNKVDAFSFARYCPTQNDVHYNFTPDEYKDLLSLVWSKYEQYVDSSTEFFLKDHLWTPFLYEKGLFKIGNNSSKTIMEGCGCSIRHLSILSDGTIYACRRFHSPVGNILKDDLNKVFFEISDTYRDYNNMECFDCVLFSYCRGCPAVSYGTYGSFYKKDPQCWFGSK